MSLPVTSRSRRALALAGVIGASALTGAGPAAAAADPLGRSTLDQTIALQARDGLRSPIAGPGARPLVRSSFGSVARAQSPRQRRSPPGRCYSSRAGLGSISRLLVANVRGGRAGASAGRTPAGNVELLLLDPRRRQRLGD